MKPLLTLLAVACVTLALAAPAQAQYYPNQSWYNNNMYQNASNYGIYPNYGVYPNTSFYQNYNYTPRIYHQGHFDFVPGRVVPHRNHYHYVQPHVDYHIGNRRYEVQQTPWGPVISPFPHRHR